MDNEYEELTIKKVETSERGYTITPSDGWCFGGITKDMVRIAGAPEPREGMKIRFYPRGIGTTVRGVMLEGVMLYYRDHAAQQRKHDLESAAENMRREAELASSQVARDTDRAKLPENFRRRLDGFEQRNPNWRRDFEPYEMSCCVDAVKIADALKTPDAVAAFGKLPWKEQNEAVPGLFDGHSGNSFGKAVRLAWLHLRYPGLVEREHGAMCPLVGCKDYGCPQAIPERKEA